MTLERWNATFAQYLTERLEESLGCNTVLQLLPTPDAAYGVVANNEAEFLLVSAGIFNCIQVSGRAEW